MTLAEGDWTIREELSLFTPLGIRFWDPAGDRQVRDALRVRAWPEAGVGPIVEAFRTASDVYAFQGLPGMREIERGAEATAGSSPPAARGFVVQVEDLRRRFLPVALAVTLPLSYRGLFLSAAEASPLEASPSGFLLFSAPTRTAPGWAAVRGELTEAGSGEPAAHALVRARFDSGESHYGLSDDGGRFALLFPYPTLVEGLGGSPLDGNRAPLHERSWGFALEVYYQPSVRQGLAATALPDLPSVLRQGQAQLFEEDPGGGGSGASEWPGELTYGTELIVRTEGLSTLAVSAAES